MAQLRLTMGNAGESHGTQSLRPCRAERTGRLIGSFYVKT